MDEQPETLEELLLNDSFVRWIRNQSDAREEAFWADWVQQHPRNKRLAAEAEELLQAMAFDKEDTSDVEQELSRLNQTIDAETDQRSRLYPSRSRRRKMYRYVAAAAVLLLVVTSGYLVMERPFSSSSQELTAVPVQTTINERVIRQDQAEQPDVSPKEATGRITTEYAEKSTLILNDGTKVVLNAQSELTYPRDYAAGRDVTVQLKGEAYFEVAENRGGSSRTFTVQTPDGSVSVLGTKFSVQTRDQKTHVALKQGVVEVNPGGNGAERKYKMKPGELAQFSKASSAVEVAEINPEVYFSWTENKLRFHNTSLSEIVWRIEQTYGVQVVVGDKSLLDKEISGSIQNNDLDVLLKALSELLQTPVNRNQTTITIDTN